MKGIGTSSWRDFRRRGTDAPRTGVFCLVSCFLFLVSSAAHAQSCKGTVYLTIDTGHMEPAEAMAAILKKHQVKATFFLANEKTKRGDTSLDPSWAPFWRGLVADAHRFGSHTWRHWYFRGDPSPSTVNYVAWSGNGRETLDQAAFCAELKRPEDAFRAMTGQGFSPIWRAPGGKLTANTQRMAKACGYTHVAWSDAGFSGDELPSDKFPSDALIKKQIATIRDGDILLWHLGIWSRKDPLWPRLEDLILGLKARGLCFGLVGDKAP
jgi:peptidoglycan/xylan/chitin deacetylase (PgdA/CDA1 family)